MGNGAYISPEEKLRKEIRAYDSISNENLNDESDPDKVILNCRIGKEEDGLADLESLKKLFYGDDLRAEEIGERERVRSTYGEGYGLVEGEEENWYVSREPEVQSGSGWRVKEDPKVVAARKRGTWEEKVRRGDFEPKYTNCELLPVASS